MKIKYNPIGTSETRLSEYGSQCKDEHEAEINLAIGHFGLDKELFYTKDERRAAAEFTLKRELKFKIKRVTEMLDGSRMSDKEIKKSLESKKRIKKANTENAKKPRKDKPTKIDLDAFKSKWEFEHGTFRGWIKEASRQYELDRKTISAIYNEKEK